MVSRNASLGLLLVTALAAACDQSPETTGPMADPSAAVVPAEQATDMNLIAERASAFGGMFLDETGTPNVYVTDMSQAPRLRQMLRDFAEKNGAAPEDIRFIPAAFRFQALNGWYERTWPQVMALQGTVFSDLDEASNQILFGVERAGLATAVAAIMRGHGVPASAYSVKVVEPVQQLATLRDLVNPKVGGLQIHFSRYLCTLGFNISIGGKAGFVTNSHCTAVQGGTEGTLYYQPSSSASGVIATEVLDPQYFKGGVCPKGKKCRYSDSSRAEYAAGVQANLGGIAVTNGDNLTITGTVNITSEIDNTTSPVAVGGTVTKTGRTTGTSSGKVTKTCVNTSVQGSQVMQLCQTFVTAAVGSGDSGSPVRNGNALVGILWGGSGSSFVFSPLKSIKDELGAFSAH